MQQTEYQRNYQNHQYGRKEKKVLKRKKRKKIKIRQSDMIYTIITRLLGIIIVFLFFFPLWYIVIASFSRPYYVINGDVILWFKEFTLGAYQQAFQAKGIWRGYGNSVFITVFGTVTNMIFTTTLAFALSRKELPFRKFFNFFTVFTMLFTAGMIPLYRTLMNYNLIDTYWGNIIAFGINTFNVIILRSFFEQIPNDYFEAARIDGAGTFRTFFKIVLPLSKASLATVTLFYAVSRWNGYFWSSIILKSESKQPLQVLLKKLLVEQTDLMDLAQPVTSASLYAPTTIAYAIIVISILPMILIFPYIQKYFKTGVNLGGVKG